MNKVILMGRLTRDPEVRYSAGDSSLAVAKYTLAVDRRSRRGSDNEPTADFFNCTAFGKGAEFAERYFHKGIKIAVTGRLQNHNYTNRDGEKVYSVDIIVDDQEFVESKGASGGVSEMTRQPRPQSAAPSMPAPSDAIPADGFNNYPGAEETDDDLPW